MHTPPRRLASTPRIADRLRQAIFASRKSINSIARGCGIPPPVLYRFVYGQRDLTLRTADKLLAYFGLELQPGDSSKYPVDSR